MCIGPASATQSYLRPEILITAALGSGCDAIHPGYGFLSERAQFSRMCAEAGITFIGQHRGQRSLGDKLSAVQLARRVACGVPGMADKIDRALDFERLWLPGMIRRACRWWERHACACGEMRIYAQLAAAEASTAAFGDLAHVENL